MAEKHLAIAAVAFFVTAGGNWDEFQTTPVPIHPGPTGDPAGKELQLPEHLPVDLPGNQTVDQGRRTKEPQPIR